MRRIDLTDQVFGKLTVLGRGDSRRIGSRSVVTWKCQCECGQITEVLANNLRRGLSTTCGLSTCRNPRSKVHGERKSITYTSWTNMKNRCLNANATQYKYYGGRGIKVCDRWMDFTNFLADMGHRPGKEYSIERENVNGDYCPENCIWLLKSEQSKNRRSYAA